MIIIGISGGVEEVAVTSRMVDGVHCVDVVYRLPPPQEFIEVRIVDSIDHPDPDALGSLP